MIVQSNLADLTERLREPNLDPTARDEILARVLANADPDDVLSFLKDEADRFWNVDREISLRLAEALVAAAELAGRDDHRAFGLLAQGNVFLALGQCDRALVLIDEAARGFECQGHRIGWARTCISQVLALRLLGRGAEGLDVAQRAHAILVDDEEWLRAGGLSLNVGTIHHELGQYDRALQSFDEAIAYYRQARARDESLGAVVEIRIAKARVNQANILTLRGDFATALRFHQEARATFEQHGETLLVLLQDWNIADVHVGQGHYSRALRLYLDVYHGHQAAGRDVDAAFVALCLIECYLSLNQIDDAVEIAEKTIDCFDRHGMHTETAKGRFYAGLAHARGGDVERALALIDVAARDFAAAGLATFVGYATLLRANLLLDQADWPAALAESRRAAELFAEQGVVARQAQAGLLQARAALALGDHALVDEVAQSVERTVCRHGLLWLAHESHHLQARIADARGDVEQARAACEAAISSIERVQGRLANELRTNFLADKMQVYHDAIAYSLRLGQPDPAFGYLERAKSRALVDYLASNAEVPLRGQDSQNQDRLDELARLREEHNWFYTRLYGLGLTARADTVEYSGDRAELQREIDEREKRITQLLGRLAVDRADGLDLAAAEGADHLLGVPVLAENTVLLEYYFSPDAAFVFVVSQAGLTAVPLAARPADVRQLLRRWQLAVDHAAEAAARGERLDRSVRGARGLLESLYQALIQPVQSHLAGCERLIVVPFGVTHSVPFHALHDGLRYLIETMEVSVCPSSGLRRLCASRRRLGEVSALVLGHSNEGRLASVLDEARAVAALLPGECYVEDGATRAVLRERAPRHSILHLAAHGEARLDNPTFAHVQLADGQLNTIDVFNLDLDGALVTLSACESGRGVVTGGDELIGLSRGFLYAGAATLVQSLWRVEDRATTTIMERFYRELTVGQPAGAALRAAQLAFLADHGAHPFFWAPFQLIGDDGRR